VPRWLQQTVLSLRVEERPLCIASCLLSPILAVWCLRAGFEFSSMFLWLKLPTTHPYLLIPGHTARMLSCSCMWPCDEVLTNGRERSCPSGPACSLPCT
jgi:hypothetical protein